MQVDLGLDAPRVHHRRDGKDDGGGDHALHRPGQDFGHGHQPDRARRLDPVLDLAGEPEFLGHLQGDGLDPLEHDGYPHDPRHEHGGERR